MPYSIKWGPEEAYCKFSGEVSGQEIIECNMTMYGSASFDDIRTQIFDMLDVAKINFGPDDVKIIAACDRVAARINPRLNHPALKVQGFEPGLKVPNRV